VKAPGLQPTQPSHKSDPASRLGKDKVLLLYPITYLYEAGFSALVVIKTNYRNRLDPEHDKRYALVIKIEPNIEKLVDRMQLYRNSHLLISLRIILFRLKNVNQYLVNSNTSTYFFHKFKIIINLYTDLMV
jgi:hypothetical protein